MAGHSKFANIKHRKGAQDKKRAKLFTKLTREIIVAAGEGLPDPASNPRLRAGLAAARKAGVPKDKIEYAIKKGAGEIEGEAFVEIRYEGYGPAGVALIVEVATDNKNRSAAEVRSTFSKNGGNMGETGSVAFMFDRVGLMQFSADVGGHDAVFEAALEAGATDCASDNQLHEVTTEPDEFNDVREALAETLGDPEESGLNWKPQNPVELTNKDDAEKVIKLIDALEELDDVVLVASNMDIPDEIAEALANSA